MRHAPHEEAANGDDVRAQRDRLEHVRARAHAGVEDDCHL